MKMDTDFDEHAWKYLIILAEDEISGNAIAKGKIAEALKPICDKLVFLETFDVALEDVDSAVALKIRSWLDWYVLHQELEDSHLPRMLEKFFTAGQIVLLSGMFLVIFLFDRSTHSFFALDAEVLLSMLGFAGFTFFSGYFSKQLKRIKIRGKVASLILSSINRILINQQEGK